MPLSYRQLTDKGFEKSDDVWVPQGVHRVNLLLKVLLKRWFFGQLLVGDALDCQREEFLGY